MCVCVCVCLTMWWIISKCTIYTRALSAFNKYKRFGWKVHRLTKIFLWKVTKEFLFFNVVPLVIHTRLLSGFVRWDCRIHWLHLCRGYDSFNECPGYGIKQSDTEASVMLDLCGKRRSLYCHRSQVQFGPELLQQIGSYLRGQKDLNCV